MRALMHVVQLEQNPLDGVERALATVVYAGALDGSPEEYRDALDDALASPAPLARLGPEYHPEVIVRRYLHEIRRRLAGN
ncbi:MAG: hypothetical protein ACTHU0_37160 [Kofleriaceae bacterium]